MARDRLLAETAARASYFTFDEKVAAAFDDMLLRSVPLHRTSGAPPSEREGRLTAGGGVSHSPRLRGSAVRLMDRADIVARVTALLGRQLPESIDGRELDECTGLLGQGIGLDSVEVLQLVGAIEEDFELTIDDEALVAEHFATIGTLVTFVSGQLPR